MPLLDAEHVQQLLDMARTPNDRCCRCGAHIAQDYCRTCDEFYFLHSPGCIMYYEVKHHGHRLTIVPFVEGDGLRLRCGWCDELIDPNEPREQKGNMHDECAFGAVFSVSHIQRRCSCYMPAGAEHRDPPGLTKRQAARASLELARKLDALGVLWMNEPR